MGEITSREEKSVLPGVGSVVSGIGFVIPGVGSVVSGISFVIPGIDAVVPLAGFVVQPDRSASATKKAAMIRL
jgi:hypothetical protein